MRNGYLPERTVQTGLGDVDIRVPKVRDRSESGIKFNSHLLPPYLKRSTSVEEMLPWLYLLVANNVEFKDGVQVIDQLDTEAA